MMKAAKKANKSQEKAPSPPVWARPWPYVVLALLFAALGVGSYFASQNQWLVWYGGMVAYNGALFFAALVAISLSFSVTKSLRTWLASAWSITLSSNAKGPREQYENLDALRLFLAVSVLFCHGYNATGPKLTGLFFAVPCFLAISGFVVLQSFEHS